MSYAPHHVALTVADLEASIEWYGQVFGTQVASQFTNSTGDMQIALLKLGDSFCLELIANTTSSPLPAYRQELMSDLKTIGTKHLCLEVDDLQQEISHLESLGISPETELDEAFFGGEFVFIKDPSGNFIELHAEN